MAIYSKNRNFTLEQLEQTIPVDIIDESNMFQELLIHPGVAQFEIREQLMRRSVADVHIVGKIVAKIIAGVQAQTEAEEQK